MRAVALSAMLLTFPAAASAQLLQVMQNFEQRCAQCHGNAAAATEARAPNRDMLAQLTPERVLAALTTGSMQANAAGMSDGQKRGLAEYITGRPVGSSASGAASNMKNQCTARPLVSPLSGPGWNGWGAGPENTRFQTAAAAGLSAAEVPKLALKWAFAFPNGTSAFGQPAVGGGRVFVGSDNGFVYSLDAATGCVYWSFEAKAGVRTAISLGAIATPAGTRYAAYFGDLRANVFAVDAETGALIWTARADTHAMARITGAPALAGGRLYVPVSSMEEGAGSNDRYECCTFRGSVASYDAATGKLLWQSYMVEPPKPTRKNKLGTQLYEPSGVATWSAPTIDVKRNVLYVTTGNEYSGPGGPTSDAVVALDLATGKRVWVTQMTPKDVFVVGCNPQRENCPDDEGPDFDFGNSAILRDLPGGRSIIVIGQKSGVAWGIDPDNKGAVVWQRRVGRGSPLGGLEWGSAADASVGYFPVSDLLLGPEVAGGLHALKLDTGEPVWSVRPPRVDCVKSPALCVQAQSAAITVIPGVIFTGATNGFMRAHATDTGKLIWEFDTARDYTTVNGVAGKGGSLNGPGPVVAGGMLFMNSGYNYLGFGAGGNVLLAFSPQ